MRPRRNVTYSARPTHAARSAHAKGDKLFRTYDTSAIRPKRNPASVVIGIVVLIIAALVIIFGLFTFFKGCSSSNLVADGTKVTVVVEEGEGANSVAKTLVEKGLIANANEFTDYLSKHNASNSLHPGTFTLIGGSSIEEMVAILQTPVQPEMFTIPEGSTVKQTAAIVAEASKGSITAAEFEKAASDASVYAASYDFLEDVGTHSLEGFLFPKTYPIESNSTADSLIRAMLDQFALETANLNYSYARSQDLSFYDVVKLASIIEKEAGAEHRGTVSSVFYNRMEAGMRLESDATIAYVVGHDPTPDDVAMENDYNTYFIDGLPPTPINSPSLACLIAACNPEDTPYYFFYFEEDGNGVMQYYFSETYEEHLATFE